jgi:hypothetical protein
MSAVVSPNPTAVKKKRHLDLAKPTGIGLVVIAMLPLVIMPLLSIFIFGCHFLAQAKFDYQQRSDRLQCDFWCLSGLGDDQV